MTEYIRHLQNKAIYKLHNMVYDKNAEKYIKSKNSFKQKNTNTSQPYREHGVIEGMGETMKGMLKAYGFRSPLHGFRLINKSTAEGFDDTQSETQSETQSDSGDNADTSDNDTTDTSGSAYGDFNISTPQLPSNIFGNSSGTDTSGNDDTDSVISTSSDTSGNTSPQPPISVSSIIYQAISYIMGSLFIVFAIIFAMIIANQYMAQSWVIRIIMFLFTFILLLINPIMMFIFFIYFIGKVIFAAYSNSKVENPADKIALLPHIFALLPITTHPAESKLGQIFKYPFFYPKTEKSRDILNADMTKYANNVRGGISNIDYLEKKFSILKTLIDEYRQKIHDLHNPT